MKKTLFAVTLIILTLSFVCTANADMLTGGLVSGKYTTFKTTSNGNTATSYVGHMDVTNLTTNVDFQAFCGDHNTYTSSDFGNANKGQAYGAYSLWDSSLTIYTQQQKEDVNSVFGYLYGLGFDTTTGDVTDKTTAIAMQLMIWEILGDSDNGFDLYTGDFLVHTDSLSTEQKSILTKVDEYALMLVNDNWGDMIFTQYDMTVYVAEGGKHASQTLISVENTTTPEPASLLIFGAGLVLGAPVLRRRMKNLKNAA